MNKHQSKTDIMLLAVQIRLYYMVTYNDIGPNPYESFREIINR